ncbi:MAG: alpha/beta hydrolase [Bacteroidota bacterium]|nr:alpha/beta hydrolase [Candidatus Kapabacteria bacterium]MDW8219492.1 alpha/beta hydrolase [Bacteroidota bacterium]
MKPITILLCSSALLCTVQSCATMDGFMFNPQQVSEYALSDSIIPKSAVEPVTMNSGGFKIYGFFIKSPRATPTTPTIFYHHGNFQGIQAYWDRMEYLYKAGYNTFIYDYRGYGKSEGKSSQESLEADAEAALAYLLSRRDVDKTNIVLYGYSLGGVPSVYLASKYATPNATFQPKGLITEAIFASATDLVQSGTLLDIPGGFLMRDEFSNLHRIRQIRCPLLLMHGTADRFIDITRHGEKLFAAAPDNLRPPKEFLRIPGAGHSTIPETMLLNNYIAKLQDFTTKIR